MSKAEKTRAYIIERSSRTFNMKGYTGTSLSDIVDATGLTKGAIYGNFANKDEIAVAVYQYNYASLQKRIDLELAGKKPGYEKLLAFIGYYRKNWKMLFERGGCPVQNASIEADDNLEVLKKHVQNSIISWAKDVSDMIEEGIEKGEFKPYINVPDYAFTFISLLEGGIMLSKIMNNQQLLLLALDRIELIINKELRW